MDPQCPIYPQRVRKRSIGLIYAMAAKKTKKKRSPIENGSAACDLPPEGPKKKSWADLTHLAHFADLADLAKISAQKCKKSVPGEGAPT